MPKFKYAGDDGRVFPAVPVLLDERGEAVEVAPFTLNDGDVIDVPANPDKAYFTAVKSGIPVEADPARVAPADAAPVDEQAAPAPAEPLAPPVAAP
jgi:hypothetical protein